MSIHEGQNFHFWEFNLLGQGEERNCRFDGVDVAQVCYSILIEGEEWKGGGREAEAGQKRVE
jgi:hypothetical protein